jgi:hypothetical protein
MVDKNVRPAQFGTSGSQKLVSLIEQNAHELTMSYLRDIKEQTSMPTYRAYDEAELYKRAHRVYSQLGQWISQEATREETKDYWTELGRQRREEGFALSEIIRSLHLIRRHLWLKVQAEGLLDTALDLYQAMELHNRVIVFFDRAVYYAAIGFETKL